MSEKFRWVVAQSVIRCGTVGYKVVVGRIIVSPCLPTEAFRDISVTFMVLVKVKVRVR